MGDLWMLAGAAVVTAMLALLLRQDSPVLAFAVALAGGLFILTGMLPPLRALTQTAHSLFAAVAGAHGVYVPVAKAVGIAAVVRVAGAICRDAGQSALAVQLELAGAAAAVAVCLPLFGQVIELAGGMLA